MVARHAQVSILNRRLKRSVKARLKGVFAFTRSRNSIYHEQQYLELFLTAMFSTMTVMMNGASIMLNKLAHAGNQEPLYRRHRRRRKDGSFKTDKQYFEEKYFPSAKTMLHHIKKSFRIDDSGQLVSNRAVKHNVNPTEARIECVLSNAVRRDFIGGDFSDRIKGVAAAFDLHDQDYYGLLNEYLVRTYGDGTNRAYRYGSSRLLGSEQYCLPPLLVPSHSTKVGIIERAVRQFVYLNIPLRTLVIDRFFFDAHVINLFNRLGLWYVMPAKIGAISNTMKKCIRGASPDHVSTYEYVVRPKSVSRARTTIVVVPAKWQHPPTRNPKEGRRRRKPEPMVFVTNIPAPSVHDELDEWGRELSRLYRLRFGIETDWSLFKSLRPRTTSMNPVVRLFYFYMGVLLYDLWVFARRIHENLGPLRRLEFIVLYLPFSNVVPLILLRAGDG
jgi:hypothetical protein